MSEEKENSLDVAVIGMSGRFAKSSSIDELWENLIQGKDCITRDPSKYRANYVGAYGKVENIEYFDADFFGFNTREAMNSDPQQRFMLEGVYEALEDAGYNSHRYEGRIALYSTSDEHLYVWNYLMHEKGDWYLNYHMSEFNLDGTFNTMIAYKLNLQGPCVLSKYACASSLAAIHQAYQGLLNYECDMAVAGGVCLEPEQEGCNCFDSTVSRTGYVRAFDEKADGLVKASGQGIVVLKRMEDALEDHDQIIAVLKGTNLNNDGNRKAGFSAPSVQGQEEAIRDALTIANVRASDVGYFETHGTGTVLGDSVELRALKNIFQDNSIGEKVFIGSMKPNIGHTSTASGVANFIKACLMLNKKIMPPSIHFQQPNNELLDEDSPIVVNNELREWHSSKPRIAGISSFGMGGANAIAILSEYEQEPHSYVQEEELLVISGKTETSLINNCITLAEFLRKHPNIELKDAAYTLQVGRGSYNNRYFITSATKDKLIEGLENLDRKRRFTTGDNQKKKVVFAFSGAGSCGGTRGRELFDSNAVFRREMNQCFEIIKSLTGEDYKQLYLEDTSKQNELFKNPLTGMVITFAIGYSLAQLWMEVGIKPDILIGHSLGEYIAACLSGILNLEAALEIIVKRAVLFNQLPEGKMLGVALSKEKLIPLLIDGVTIGAENGERRYLVSGLSADIDRFVKILEDNQVTYTALPVNRAGHCSVVDVISDDYRNVLAKIQFYDANIPIVSTYSGTWATNNEMSNPDYWINQMKYPVMFHSAIREISSHENNVVFIEIGLSDQLTELIKKSTVSNKSVVALSTITEYKSKNSREGFLNAVGKLYGLNMDIKWEKMYSSKPYRVSLPTYQFDRRAYWKYKKHFNGDNDHIIVTNTDHALNIDSDKNESSHDEEIISECRNSTDVRLKEIFTEVLGQEGISIHDDLYEIGFDSLSIVLVTSKIETVFNKIVSMKDIYAITTIAELSDLLDTMDVSELTEQKEEKQFQPSSKSIDNLFDEI